MPHFDPAPYREARGNERWILVGAFVFALAALVGIVVEDYEPVKLAPVFMLLAWFPLIAVHELGHAAAAKLVGWEVDVIVIGFGSVAFAFEIFGVPCALKMYPLGGFVRPAPLDLRAVRLKSAFVYLAGPLAELAVPIALLLVLGWDAMTSRTDDVGVIAAQAISVAALLGVATNLVPRGIDTERGTGVTDGLGAVSSLWRPRATFEAQVRDALVDRLAHHASLQDAPGTIGWAERAAAALPHDAHLRSAMRRALREALSEAPPDARRQLLAGRALPEPVVEKLTG